MLLKINKNKPMTKEVKIDNKSLANEISCLKFVFNSWDCSNIMQTSWNKLYIINY